MKEQFYTVEQISKFLNIHPKTVQRYIREGKLRAAKIGKSWRVSGHDLSLFTEENGTDFTDKIASEERSKASAVIDIKVYRKEEADRIINSLTAAMNVKPREYGEASMFTQYLEADNQVRLTLFGNVSFLAAVFSVVELFLKQYEEEAI